MNICVISRAISQHGIRGGMEMHCEVLSKELVRRRHNVTIITTKHPHGIKEEDDDGIKIHYVDKGNSARYFGFALPSVKKYVELSQNTSFDLIWSQSLGAEFIIRRLANSNQLPPVVTILHGIFLWEARNLVKNVVSFWELAKVSKKYVTQLYKHYFWKRCIEKADAVICVSKELVEIVKQEYPIVSKNNAICYIPNGYDKNNFFPSSEIGGRIRKELGVEKNKILLFVGRIEKEKGLQYAIKALRNVKKLFPDTKLIVIGDGSYKEKIISSAKNEHVLDNVRFLGYIENEKLVDYYNCCDIFVLPTIRLEGFPITLAEVMACQKPIIASKIGGIPSAIDAGVNGILVSPGDINALTEKIVMLFDNKELADKLAMNAREKALRAFSKEIMVNDTLKVFERCLSV